MKNLLVCGCLCIFVLLMAQTETLAQSIYGCVSNRNGTLRIVSDLALCTAKETRITLNQGGSPGPQGPAGQDGLACWDLNGNSLCDVSTEDINTDGICDALDCKGEPGSTGGGIKVYDSSVPRQYLGILLGHSGWNPVMYPPGGTAYGNLYAEVYIPSLRNTILINKSGQGPYAIGGFPGAPPEVTTYFADSTCGNVDSTVYLELFVGH
jgi:hypothetical protein